MGFRLCAFIVSLVVALCLKGYAQEKRVDSLTLRSIGPHQKIASYVPAPQGVDFIIFQFSSPLLAKFDEPILYTAKADREVYRLLYTRAFNLPMVISFTKVGEDVFLEIKKGSKEVADASGYDPSRLSISQRDSLYYYENTRDSARYFTLFNALAHKMFRKDTIEFRYSTKKILRTIEEWSQFEKMVDESAFWSLPRVKLSGAYDGVGYLLEARTKKGYHVISRENPLPDEQSIINACEFLINLSDRKVKKNR
jgi:hypothetical protein